MQCHRTVWENAELCSADASVGTEGSPIGHPPHPEVSQLLPLREKVLQGIPTELSRGLGAAELPHEPRHISVFPELSAAFSLPTVAGAGTRSAGTGIPVRGPQRVLLAWGGWGGAMAAAAG